MADTGNPTNSALLRAIALLEKVAEADRPLTATELVTLSKLPKPTVHRVVQQLEEEGLLQREPPGKRYGPGFRLRSLARQVMISSASTAPRRAVLQALSEELEETCNITMLDGNELVYLERVESNWPVRIQLQPGSHLPLHCTASGKLFLAYMPTRLRQTLLTAAPLKRCTEHTIIDPGRLEEECRRIAAEGVSTDNEELIRGMVAVAVPIETATGEIYSTVAVHAPTLRRSLEDLRQHTPALRRAAAALASIFEMQSLMESPKS